MMAYLAMMVPRLVELRRAFKSTGSLHLHCAVAGAILALSACTGRQSITVQIQDDNGKPVADAEVKLHWPIKESWNGPSAYQNATMQSDKDGRIQLLSSARIVDLEVNKIGFY